MRWDNSCYARDTHGRVFLDRDPDFYYTPGYNNTVVDMPRRQGLGKEDRQEESSSSSFRKEDTNTALSNVECNKAGGQQQQPTTNGCLEVTARSEEEGGRGRLLHGYPCKAHTHQNERTLPEGALRHEEHQRNNKTI